MHDGFDEQVEALHRFEGSLADMLEFAQNLFDADYGRWTVEIGENGSAQVHTIATGGWSDNEAVIGALQGTMFHSMCWKSSAVGGLHVYEVRNEMLATSEKFTSWGIMLPSTAIQLPGTSLTVDALATILDEALVQIRGEQPDLDVAENQLQPAAVRALAEIIMQKILAK